MLKHMLKFAGLMLGMYAISYIPLGMYVNSAIVIYSLWNLVK